LEEKVDVLVRSIPIGVQTNNSDWINITKSKIDKGWTEPPQAATARCVHLLECTPLQRTFQVRLILRGNAKRASLTKCFCAKFAINLQRFNRQKWAFVLSLPLRAKIYRLSLGTSFYVEFRQYFGAGLDNGAFFDGKRGNDLL